MDKTIYRERVLAKLPKGIYWVTDPCYIFSSEAWNELINRLEASAKIYPYPEGDVFIWSTAYGDGIYELKGPTSGSLCVDAGLLSIVPDLLFRKHAKYSATKLATLAVKVKIAEGFEVVQGDEPGDVEFAGYSVCTSGSDADDDEGDWD